MVRQNLLWGAAISAALSSGLAIAADLAVSSAARSADQYDWSGLYVGVTAGAAWGVYDPRTSTVSDGYIGPSAALVAAAGAQTIHATGFAAGIEGGYNWQVGNLLLGFEADAAAVNLTGATNSGAIHYLAAPPQFTVTSYGNTDWLVTARPRVGVVAPNHWLLYATGGIALTQLQSDFSFVDNFFALESGRLDTTKVGYAVGGGIEAPLTSRLSMKIDYLYVDFANTAGAVTSNNLAAPFPGQVFSHSSDFKSDIIRAGLNYRFGGPDVPAADDRTGPPLPFKTPAWLTQPSLFAGWKVETGVRLWLSSGSAGAPQPLIDIPPPTLASRLIFAGLNAVSGEAFARVDDVSGFFVKGNLGAGGITSGRLNDEDFPGGHTYSNTFSSARGQISYTTIDVGYDMFHAPGAKVGPFIGYNYYTQAINTYGCSQLAGGTICSPAFPSTLLALTESDSFNSLRVGLSSEVMLTDRLRLTTDAAYMPWVSFSGLDDHLLRQLLLPEASSSGSGVMLEAILDYAVTPAWRVGVGGRYWAWNMNTGTEVFDFLAVPSFPATETARFTAERYGAFVQSSYRWGEPTPDADSSRTKEPVVASAPTTWTGFYLGGHLGGGFSNGQWSDPFGSTVGPFGFMNIAGFGDTTHATGAIAGGQIGANWQIGALVAGAQVDASAANLRGENTCFSGIGGINCQHSVNAVSTITARVGYAWDRSVAYVKGGGAWTDNTYSLFGNTNALALGTGSTTLGVWGWTVGGGVEYALSNHWTAVAEYDHIGLPTTVVPFPTVALINVQTIGVKQTIDLFKLGVNYKFQLADVAAPAGRGDGLIKTPALAAPLPPAPGFSWTGLYLGLNAGGSWDTANVSFDPTGPFWLAAPAGLPGYVGTQGSPSLHGSGFTGGGQAGYNYQTGNVVVGIEADIDYWGLNISHASPVLTYPMTANFAFAESVSTNWLATVRPRIGRAFGHWLLYATGGLAVGNQDFAESMTFIGSTNAAGSVNQTKAGWTAGGGLQYAFTNQISAKVEYLYVDIGSVGFTTTFTGLPTLFQTLSSHLTASIARIGLNYKFN